MKRILFVVALCVGLASSASAASLGLQVQGGGSAISGLPGDAFTLELTADVSNPEATLSLGLDVRLLGGGSVTWTGATQTGLTSFGMGLMWTEFAPICAGADPCVAVNQGNPVLPTGAQPDQFNGVIATITGTLDTSGQITVDVQDFFGAAAPAAISVNVVPEPSTAAILALGLMGLGVAGRRR